MQISKIQKLIEAFLDEKSGNKCEHSYNIRFYPLWKLNYSGKILILILLLLRFTKKQRKKYEYEISN